MFEHDKIFVKNVKHNEYCATFCLQWESSIFKTTRDNPLYYFDLVL